MWNLIDKDKMLFLLIDLQEKFYPILNPKVVASTRANILLIMRLFSHLEIPTIGTEQNRTRLGPTDAGILDEWSGAPFTDKVTFSCCDDSAFMENLEKFKRPLVVVAGFETHICVLQTVLDLLSKNYTVAVVKDACLSTTKLKWDNGLELMKDAGAHIVNTETLLFAMLKRIDTPEFKFFLKILKEKNQKEKDFSV